MDHLVRQFEVEAVEAALRFAVFVDAGEVFRLGSVDQTLSLWVTSRNHKVESLREAAGLRNVLLHNRNSKVADVTNGGGMAVESFPLHSIKQQLHCALRWCTRYCNWRFHLRQFVGDGFAPVQDNQQH